MNIEIRKNGTFYLKDSIYNPETKLPKNTSIYLGSNPIQAKEKLKSLTENPDLLAQIPDIHPYEFELHKTLKHLQKLNGLQTEAITKLINDYLNELLSAKQFIISAQEGLVAHTTDCPGCRFNKVNHCGHFKQHFMGGNGKYKDGKPIRCLAYEFGQSKPTIGSIKFPRDFRV